MYPNFSVHERNVVLVRRTAGHGRGKVSLLHSDEFAGERRSYFLYRASRFLRTTRRGVHDPLPFAEILVSAQGL